MGTKNYVNLAETVLTHRLLNGLEIYIVPKREYNKSFAFFATNYGGADRRFKLGENWVDTPEGVAHFLEHKMFDTKDGNALTLLSANGSSPNAFTSSDMTAYHFECIDKFEENLRILLDFVSVPYFTEESVQKEQGIIGQEIRMSEDDPYYNVYYNLMKLLYRENPIRDSIAGTIESIAEITAETLYDCHRVFYNPSNMVLCVAGNIDPDKVLRIAEEILPALPGPRPEKDYGGKESKEPAGLKSETDMAVSLPLFFAGAKTSVDTDAPTLREELTGELALEVLAGRSSPLYSRLYENELINNDFSADYESAAGASYIIFGGESRYPDKVMQEVVAEAEKIGSSGLDAEFFGRVKKAKLGAKLRELNSLERICYNLSRGYFRGYDPFESVELLGSVSEGDIVAFISENINAKNIAVSIINPKRKI
jgi:predicted Zn-dependent peptidase